MSRPCGTQIDQYILLRLGAQAQDALRQQRAHMAHEQHQLAQEQRASLRIIESVTQERDVVRWA